MGLKRAESAAFERLRALMKLTKKTCMQVPGNINLTISAKRRREDLQYVRTKKDKIHALTIK